MTPMLFATGTLAARIEKAEAEVAAEFAGAARTRGKDVMLEPIGGTTAVYGGHGEPFNKIAGLGFRAPLEAHALAALEAKYDARDGEIRVEQSTLADPSVAIMLTRRGYELIGYENVLGLALTPAIVQQMSSRLAEDAAAGVAVARARPDEVRLWIETVTDGFLQPDTFDGPPPTETFPREVLLDVYEGFVGLGSSVLYLARRGGDVAGGGSLRISDGLAQLSGAATLQAHRRRGVQSALMRARLVDAAANGADIAVVTTEPGSKSQQNVQRAGFELLYSRAILRRPARSAAGASGAAAI
jgi:ribosomal protein S18 acetylase RimI-like enzyme